ncbi:MAG: S-layer homology domain-containing protein [Bacillota bacterium]
MYRKDMNRGASESRGGRVTARNGLKGARHDGALALLVVGLVIAATASVAGAAANPFADVPKGHWSYDALAEFARLGLVEGYSPEAFRGGRAITRYEMAWAIARLADRVKAGAELTAPQRASLTRLQEEFAGELALVAGTGKPMLSGVTQGEDGAGGPLVLGGVGASPGATTTSDAAGAGNAPMTMANAPGSSPVAGTSSLAPFAASPGMPGLPESFQAWSSLRLHPDPGVVAALSAIPGDAGRQAFSGGKRLSELLGSGEDRQAAAPESVLATNRSTESANQKTALSIPLDDGTKAELSLGGPPAPGGIAPGEGDDVVARLDLKYALSQLAMFRASYELVKGNEEGADDSEGKSRATTLLGIDYRFALSDSAFIKAGYTYSRITDLVPRGIEVSGSTSQDKATDSDSKAAGVFGDYTLPGLSLDARKTTASFGLGYTFGGSTSIVLGYRLIDFQDLDPETMLSGSHRTNVATAELTIRF